MLERYIFGQPVKLVVNVEGREIAADCLRLDECSRTVRVDTAALLAAIDEARLNHPPLPQRPAVTPAFPRIEIRRDKDGILTNVFVDDGCGRVVELPATTVEYAAKVVDNPRGRLTLTFNGGRVKFREAE